MLHNDLRPSYNIITRASPYLALVFHPYASLPFNISKGLQKGRQVLPSPSTSKKHVSPTFCGVVAPPPLFVVCFALSLFVVCYNTPCGHTYNKFCGFALTNFVLDKLSHISMTNATSRFRMLLLVLQTSKKGGFYLCLMKNSLQIYLM